MSVSLELDFKQVKKLVDQLNEQEKERLAEYLDDETLFKQWRKVKEELQDIPLTLEDITKEVKAVRAQRRGN